MRAVGALLAAPLRERPSGREGGACPAPTTVCAGSGSRSRGGASPLLLCTPRSPSPLPLHHPPRKLGRGDASAAPRRGDPALFEVGALSADRVAGSDAAEDAPRTERPTTLTRLALLALQNGRQPKGWRRRLAGWAPLLRALVARPEGAPLFEQVRTYVMFAVRVLEPGELVEAASDAVGEDNEEVVKMALSRGERLLREGEARGQVQGQFDHALDRARLAPSSHPRGATETQGLPRA